MMPLEHPKGALASQAEPTRCLEEGAVDPDRQTKLDLQHGVRHEAISTAIPTSLVDDVVSDVFDGVGAMS
jgi:hypothetical protein